MLRLRTEIKIFCTPIFFMTGIFIYLEQGFWLQRYNESLIYVLSSILEIFCHKMVIC